MAERNQMPRDRRDSPMPVVPVVRTRTLAATTSSGETTTDALKFKAVTVWADAEACWIAVGAAPVGNAAVAQLATITIGWTTAEADDVFQAIITHQDGTTSTYTLTTTTEASASEAATALAALIDAHGSYSAAAVAEVITITGPSDGDSFSVAVSETDGGGNDDATITATQPCPNIPLAANSVFSLAIQPNDKIAAITSTGTANVYIMEHGN